MSSTGPPDDAGSRPVGSDLHLPFVGAEAELERPVDTAEAEGRFVAGPRPDVGSPASVATATVDVLRPVASVDDSPLARWLLALALVLVVLPIGAGAVSAVRQGWVPVGDEALFAVRVHDTFSEHPPLVGMPSSVTEPGQDPVSHPGPLAFWVLAPLDALLPAHGLGLVLGTALLNAGAAVATVLVVRRRAGPGMALATAVGVAVLVLALSGPVLHTPWNAHLAVLPCVLFLALAWATVSGGRSLLPWAIVAGSFTAQAHVSYLPVVGVVGLWVLGVLAADEWSDRRLWKARLAEGRRTGAKVPGAAEGLASLRDDWRREWVIALAVGLLCWVGPIFEQFRRQPGNLTALFDAGSSGSRSRQGLGAGWDRLVEAVGVPPRWAAHLPGDIYRLESPGAARTVGALLVAAASVGLAVWALRVGRPPLARWIGTAWAAALAGVLATSRLPTDQLTVLSENNRRLWAPVGLMVWLGLAWGAGALARGWYEARRPVPDHRLVLGLRLAGVAAVAVLAVASLTHLSIARDPGSAAFGPVRQLSDAVRPRLRDSAAYRIEFQGALAASLVGPGVVADLVDRGYQVLVPPSEARSFGEHRTADDNRRATGGTILVVSGPEAGQPIEGYRLVRRYDPATASAKWRRLTNTAFLVPDGPSAIYLPA